MCVHGLSLPDFPANGEPTARQRGLAQKQKCCFLLYCFVFCGLMGSTPHDKVFGMKRKILAPDAQQQAPEGQGAEEVAPEPMQLDWSKLPGSAPATFLGVLAESEAQGELADQPVESAPAPPGWAGGLDPTPAAGPHVQQDRLAAAARELCVMRDTPPWSYGKEKTAAKRARARLAAWTAALEVLKGGEAEGGTPVVAGTGVAQSRLQLAIFGCQDERGLLGGLLQNILSGYADEAGNPIETEDGDEEGSDGALDTTGKPHPMQLSFPGMDENGNGAGGGSAPKATVAAEDSSAAAARSRSASEESTMEVDEDEDDAPEEAAALNAFTGRHFAARAPWASKEGEAHRYFLAQDALVLGALFDSFDAYDDKMLLLDPFGWLLPSEAVTEVQDRDLREYDENGGAEADENAAAAGRKEDARTAELFHNARRPRRARKKPVRRVRLLAPFHVTLLAALSVAGTPARAPARWPGESGFPRLPFLHVALQWLRPSDAGWLLASEQEYRSQQFPADTEQQLAQRQMKRRDAMLSRLLSGAGGSSSFNNDKHPTTKAARRTHAAVDEDQELQRKQDSEHKELVRNRFRASAAGKRLPLLLSRNFFELQNAFFGFLAMTTAWTEFEAEEAKPLPLYKEGRIVFDSIQPSPLHEDDHGPNKASFAPSISTPKPRPHHEHDDLAALPAASTFDVRKFFGRMLNLNLLANDMQWPWARFNSLTQEEVGRPEDVTKGTKSRAKTLPHHLVAFTQALLGRTDKEGALLLDISSQMGTQQEQLHQQGLLVGKPRPLCPTTTRSPETGESYGVLMVKAGKEQTLAKQLAMAEKTQEQPQAHEDGTSLSRSHSGGSSGPASTFARTWVQGIDRAGRSLLHLLFEQARSLYTAQFLYAGALRLDGAVREVARLILTTERTRHEDAPFARIRTVKRLLALDRRSEAIIEMEHCRFLSTVERLRWRLFFSVRDLLRRSPLHVAASSGWTDALQVHVGHMATTVRKKETVPAAMSSTAWRSPPLRNSEINDLLLEELFLQKDEGEGETVYMRALDSAKVAGRTLSLSNYMGPTRGMGPSERPPGPGSWHLRWVVEREDDLPTLGTAQKEAFLTVDGRAVWMTRLLFALTLTSESPRAEEVHLEKFGEQEVGPGAAPAAATPLSEIGSRIVVLAVQTSSLGETVLHRAAAQEHLIIPVLVPLLRKVVLPMLLMTSDQGPGGGPGESRDEVEPSLKAFAMALLRKRAVDEFTIGGANAPGRGTRTGTGGAGTTFLQRLVTAVAYSRSDLWALMHEQGDGVVEDEARLAEVKRAGIDVRELLMWRLASATHGRDEAVEVEVKALARILEVLRFSPVERDILLEVHKSCQNLEDGGGPQVENKEEERLVTAADQSERRAAVLAEEVLEQFRAQKREVSDGSEGGTDSDTPDGSWFRTQILRGWYMKPPLFVHAQKLVDTVQKELEPPQEDEEGQFPAEKDGEDEDMETKAIEGAGAEDHAAAGATPDVDGDRTAKAPEGVAVAATGKDDHGSSGTGSASSRRLSAIVEQTAPARPGGLTSRDAPRASPAAFEVRDALFVAAGVLRQWVHHSSAIFSTKVAQEHSDLNTLFELSYASFANPCRFPDFSSLVLDHQVAVLPRDIDGGEDGGRSPRGTGHGTERNGRGKRSQPRRHRIGITGSMTVDEYCGFLGQHRFATRLGEVKAGLSPHRFVDRNWSGMGAADSSGPKIPRVNSAPQQGAAGAAAQLTLPNFTEKIGREGDPEDSFFLVDKEHLAFSSTCCTAEHHLWDLGGSGSCPLTSHRRRAATPSGGTQTRLFHDALRLLEVRPACSGALRGFFKCGETHDEVVRQVLSGGSSSFSAIQEGFFASNRAWLRARRQHAAEVVSTLLAVRDARRAQKLPSLEVNWQAPAAKTTPGERDDEGPRQRSLELEEEFLKRKEGGRFVTMGTARITVSDPVYAAITETQPIFLARPGEEEADTFYDEAAARHQRATQELFWGPGKDYPVVYSDNLFEIFRPIRLEDLVEEMHGLPPILAKKQVVGDVSQTTEVLLFHGGKRTKFEQILQDGFFGPMVKDSSWYGRGIYFSPQMCKSHYYAQGEHEDWAPESQIPEGDNADPANGVPGVHYMLLVRARLGRICAVTQTLQGLEKMPPHCDSFVIHPGLMWRWQRGNAEVVDGGGGGDSYHPRFKAKAQNHVEFVVMDPARLKPEYLVTYQAPLAGAAGSTGGAPKSKM